MLDKIEARADREGRKGEGQGGAAGRDRQTDGEKKKQRQRQNRFFTVAYKRGVKSEPLTRGLS